MKRTVKTLATSILVVIGVALMFTIAGSGKTWSAKRSQKPFNEHWMAELCEKNKKGDYRPDSEIKKCCQNNTTNCIFACKQQGGKSACYDRCSRASYLCFKRAGEKNPGISPAPPGLQFQKRQPRVIAPKSKSDPKVIPPSPGVQFQQQQPKVIAPKQ